MQKCTICKKKLSLVEETSGYCKCGHYYCRKHRTITNSKEELSKGSHLCSFDRTSEHRNLIKQNNPSINNKPIIL